MIETTVILRPGRAAAAGTSLRVLARAGIIRPYSPLTLARIAKSLSAWGTGPAGGFAALAARAPDQVGLVDELGALTFGEMHRRTNALARALRRARGRARATRWPLMCRNHRGFVDATIAVAKLGADLLYLNTAFAGPQLVDVLEREEPTVVIHDEEFTDLLAEASTSRAGWSRGPTPTTTTRRSSR